MHAPRVYLGVAPHPHHLNGPPPLLAYPAGRAVENRPTQVQSQQSLREHLLRKRGEPFHLVAADFHLLVFVSNVLDVDTDMPLLCHAVADGDSANIEGIKVLLNAFAEIDD